VAHQWDAYCGEAFERLCREALPLLYEKEGMSGRSQIGEYWDREVQIDVVGLRADEWIDLGECRASLDETANQADEVRNAVVIMRRLTR
jgi:AAA+ ATPase superfamily predicted ATPase